MPKAHLTVIKTYYINNNNSSSSSNKSADIFPGVFAPITNGEWRGGKVYRRRRGSVARVIVWLREKKNITARVFCAIFVNKEDPKKILSRTQFA
jgi:hypothetical protein